MVTILDPIVTNALAVRMNQPLRLVADSSTNWWYTADGGTTWHQIGAVSASVMVWGGLSSVTNHLTFDQVQIVAQTANPSGGVTGPTINVNVCEGPPAGLHVTESIRNEALEEPPLFPDALETDD